MTDKDIVRQMLERDAMSLFKSLPALSNQLGFNISPYLNMFENKILSYADVGIETLMGWLFGVDNPCDVEEAADIAKMMTNDKIDEYRKKVQEARKKEISEDIPE